IKMAAMALGRDKSGYVTARQAQCDAVRPEGQNMAADDELADEDDIQSDFAAAPLAVWLQVLGWLASFFIGLYLFGMLIVLPVFTALYLRLVSRMSLLGILAYVLGTSGAIYVLFVVLLHLPLPQGVLLSFG